ncbi:MAG: hypothetical protein M1831_003597 [Alyxoria varia]|nr:MAG: hypothetical protein M1831_003597 [Alyxoria varia]
MAEAATSSVSSQRPIHKRSRSAAVIKSWISPKKGGTTNASTQDVQVHDDKSDDLNGVPLPPNHPHSRGSRAPQRVLGEIENSSSSTGSPTKKQKQRAVTTCEQPVNGKRMEFPPKAMPKKHFHMPKEKENTTPPVDEGSETRAPIWAQFASQQQDGTSSTPQTSQDSRQDTQQPTTPVIHRGPSPLKAQHLPGQSNGTHQGVSRFTQDGRNTPRSPQKFFETGLFDSTSTRNGSSDGSSQQPSGGSESPSKPKSAPPKKSSKVIEKAAKFDGPVGKELDSAFEAVLAARNIPENMRQNMRKLDTKIKQDFIKNDRTPSNTSSVTDEAPRSSFWGTTKGRDGKPRRGRDTARDEGSRDEENSSTMKGRSRSRTRVFTFSKRDQSASKRARSNSRPRTLMSLKNFSSSSVNSFGADNSKDSKEPHTPAAVALPNDFVSYLTAQKEAEKVEVGKMHKLRTLLRNEAVSWVDEFVSLGGMGALIDLLHRIMKVEWREEHEDVLLHETLLCFKSLCTTQKALQKLNEVQNSIFPSLLKMLFDEERKGPSEFNTRGIIIWLLFKYLSAAPPAELTARAHVVLVHLENPAPSADERPMGFIEQMRQPRPYTTWCGEVRNVTKEVFWIFLHHLNVISLSPPDSDSDNSNAEGVGLSSVTKEKHPSASGIGVAVSNDNAVDPSSTVASHPQSSYTSRHFPRARPPVPAAPHIGGVEWEATNYITSHLDLMNGIIASLPSRIERNSLRQDLKASGFETLMGGTLRLCKEKFYGGVHDAMRTWVAAAMEDAWEVRDVRYGPPQGASPRKESPKKGRGSPKKELPPPKLDVPLLEGSGDIGKEDGKEAPAGVNSKGADGGGGGGVNGAAVTAPAAAGDSGIGEGWL